MFVVRVIGDFFIPCLRDKKNVYAYKKYMWEAVDLDVTKSTYLWSIKYDYNVN